jgi:hypothetical protein
MTMLEIEISSTGKIQNNRKVLFRKAIGIQLVEELSVYRIARLLKLGVR